MKPSIEVVNDFLNHHISMNDLNHSDINKKNF